MVKMATVTLSIPDDLKKKMDALPHMKWSEVLREFIIRRVKQLKKFEEMVARGEL
ncbi:MAG: hypothetical protein KKF52_05455 [Nanoarchaeota archaeon]|nr:hypothetical protein [Nanoarchaeota archaeon]MBU4352600.1 hypothetical protein [Nanoarchaeota archaeon]MCG2720103.1 hypothetical protein [Nanoarchaeota archaeon]